MRLEALNRPVPHVDDALGGQVGISPRLFLKELVLDVLDRVDQFPDFDPRQHYALTATTTELTHNPFRGEIT